MGNIDIYLFLTKKCDKGFVLMKFFNYDIEHVINSVITIS